MKTIVVAAAAAAGLLVAGMASAQDAAALAQKSGCMNCHAVDTKKMGPSFKDAAAKLKGKSDAEVVAAIEGRQAAREREGVGRRPEGNRQVDPVALR